mmetsp:Transcript_107025/g.301119  ORF Transcript_107025/g.301119 Transcript_107025/m.301119 type:complete len:932 (+) Transcript_107025:1-2796(+)|eukprot:CAMPEP_0117498884 /NCGR_PEP_ID=MMETSP0784-20121206/21950_1 /TAXON_ID=39447 /ORGANISM="" /LENGTH=931 /DNA_ID=CAMNT_0005293995 /DNA_START=11 /DNA_END=2806 /DNA_ORIENTATION=-
MGGLAERLGWLIALTLAVLAHYVFQDGAMADSLGALRTSFAHIWPPSRQSATFWFLVAFLFVFVVQRVFFNGEDTAECRRVRLTKKRLVLAQMTQALKWDADEEGDKESQQKKDGDGKEENKKKRPPSAKDLFEMLYDDVEDRHVTEYGIVACEEPYKSTFVLFKERVGEDLRDAIRYTKLARATLEEGGGDLDGDDLKFCAQFLDGTKLTELLELCRKKIQKRFGKEVVPQDLLQAAEAARKELSLAQRKGVAMLIPMLSPLLPLYAVAIVLMIFDSSFGAMTWHSMATILDGVDAGTMTMAELRMTCLSNYVIFIACIFSHLTARAIVRKVTSQFRLQVRSQVMQCMVRQDMAFFDIFPSGLLQERLNNDAEQLASKIFDMPMNMVNCFFVLVSNIYVVYTMKKDLFLMIFMPLPVVSIAQYYIIKFMEKLSERQRKIAEHAAAGTLEVLKEIRTVREFAMEEEEAEHFYANSSYRASIEEFSEAINHIVFIAPLVCMFVASRLSSTYLAGRYVEIKSMTVGQAIQVGFIGDHMQHVLRDLMMMAPEIIRVMNPLGRICDMLASEPKIEPHPLSKAKLKPPGFNGHIVFQDVDFTFPSEPQKQILFGLSFEVKPGERVAFVGSTGCGKSTSIKLIERFYTPTTGTILLDGISIDQYDVHHLRRHMSVVAQDNMLFSTTLRENIIYGIPRERRETIENWEIEEACKKANAWAFVNEFPRKLETYAGERGVKLSGGQKQRLAIARAIIRKPTIVLLDEATSALDSKAEGVVQAALDKMIEDNRNGCTIMIAHRLTTVQRCDAIIVMDKGRIMEQGSHKDLLQIPIKKDEEGKMITGWYHDLWATQMGNDDSHRLQYLERRVKLLEEENARLLRGPVDRFRMGHVVRKEAPPAPPMLELFRNKSAANEETSDSKSKGPGPPPALLRSMTDAP